MRYLLALLLLAAPLVAGSVNRNSVVGTEQSNTDFNYDIPSLTLTPREQGATQAVEVCIRYRYESASMAENLGASTDNIQVGLSRSPINVSLGSDLLFSEPTYQSVRVYVLEPFDGTLDYAGDSGNMDVFQPFVGMIAFFVTDPEQVDRLTSGEQLTVTMDTGMYTNGGGNFQAETSSNLRIDYEINPLTRLVP